MIKYMAVAVSGGVAVPVAVPVALPVAGLTKRFFNQKDFLINVRGYSVLAGVLPPPRFPFDPPHNLFTLPERGGGRIRGR